MLKVDKSPKKFLSVTLKLAYPSHPIQNVDALNFGEVYIKD
jgi:hypothetical protein